MCNHHPGVVVSSPEALVCTVKVGQEKKKVAFHIFLSTNSKRAKYIKWFPDSLSPKLVCSKWRETSSKTGQSVCFYFCFLMRLRIFLYIFCGFWQEPFSPVDEYMQDAGQWMCDDELYQFLATQTLFRCIRMNSFLEFVDKNKTAEYPKHTVNNFKQMWFSLILKAQIFKAHI